MSGIPDFSYTDLSRVRDAIEKRDGGNIAVGQADDELRLGSASRDLTDLSVPFSSEHGANLVIFKTGRGAAPAGSSPFDMSRSVEALW